MDPAAGEAIISARSLAPFLRGNSLFAVIVLVVLALAAARIIGHVPEPLLATAGLSFLGWMVVLRAWRRDLASPFTRPVQVVVAWLTFTALALGVIYRIDRGGWLWSALTGYERYITENLADRIDLPIAAFLELYPMFSADPETPSRIVLKRDAYEISESIVIPAGLSVSIEPGTVMRFGPGASLISYSPIAATGTAEQPIVFTARNRWLKWGCVAVLDAPGSVFEHVWFEHARSGVVNGVNLPGSLSVIRSDADIAHSRFSKLFGKDALYVQAAQVSIRDNVFEDAIKDGVDMDGGSGQIVGNSFIDCGDEGIDLSGDYDVEVVNNRITDAGGGRVAAEAGLEAIRARNTFGYRGAGDG